MKIPNNYDNVLISNTNSGWTSVTSVDFGGCNVEFDSGSTFQGNTSLTSIINGAVTNTSLSGTFSGDTSLSEFTCDLPNLTNGTNMFYRCSGLTSWTTELPNLTIGDNMFRICKGMKEWKAGLPNLNNGVGMFLSNVSLAEWDTELPNLQSASAMFANCSALTEWHTDLPMLTDCKWIFSACTSLTSFTANLPKLSGGANAGTMFGNCYSLKTVSANCPSLTKYIPFAFRYCSALTDVQLVVPNDLSASTASDFSISGCPATAYTYVDTVDSSSVRLTFTDTARRNAYHFSITDESEYNSTITGGLWCGYGKASTVSEYSTDESQGADYENYTLISIDGFFSSSVCQKWNSDGGDYCKIYPASQNYEGTMPADIWILNNLTTGQVIRVFDSESSSNYLEVPYGYYCVLTANGGLFVPSEVKK